MAASSSNIIIDFNGAKEVLHLFDIHSEILFYLTGQSNTTQCILTNAKIATRLGKGKQGKVFSIDLGDNTHKQYVVKLSEDTLYEIVDAYHFGKRPIAMKALAERVHTDLGLSPDIFLALNDPDRIVEPGEKYTSVQFIADKRGCKTHEPYTTQEYINHDYEHIPTGRSFVFPEGSYICNSDNHAEYMMSVICGDLERKGICENFLDVIGFSMCVRKKKLRDYVFMEKIDGDLNHLKDDIRRGALTENVEGVIDSIFLQTLFALSVMNRVAGVQHNDLHTGNVFYKRIATHPKFFKYTLDGKDIYIPNEGYLVKIGDFGFATKFSEPMLSSASVIIERSDSVANSIPSWRMDSYDMLFFVVCMFLAFGRYSRMVCRVLAYIVDGTIRIDNVYHETKNIVYDSLGEISQKMRKYYNPSWRPTFEEHPLRPWDILANVELVGDFSAPPRKHRLEGRGYKLMGRLRGYYTGYNTSHFVTSIAKMSDTLESYIQTISESGDDDYEEYTYAISSAVKYLASHPDELALIKKNRNITQLIIDSVLWIMFEDEELYRDNQNEYDLVLASLNPQ